MYNSGYFHWTKLLGKAKIIYSFLSKSDLLLHLILENTQLKQLEIQPVEGLQILN